MCHALPRLIVPEWCLSLLGIVLIAATANAQTERRLVFCGPLGPYLLHVTIESDGASVDDVRQAYAAGVIEALDRDGDGQLSGAEAADLPAQGLVLGQGPRLKSNWSEIDLEPQDGRISQRELLLHFNRVSGPPVQIVRQPPRLSQTVRLFEELDHDGDERVTAEEMTHAAERLRVFDFDDDEALSVAELQPFPRTVVQAMKQAESREAPNPLMSLDGDTEFRAAADRFLLWYGTHGNVSAARLTRFSEREFQRFDLNDDGQWDRDEIDVYLRRAPLDHRLTVSLAAAGVVEGNQPMRRFARVQLDLGMPVGCRAENREAHISDATNLYKIRFLMSDGDKSGALNETEFAGLQAPAAFTAVDLNHDQQVSVKEIDRYFTLHGLAQQCQILISLSSEAKTLFDLLDSQDSFRIGEIELGDRRLTPREFHNARSRLLESDRNHDAALTPDELSDAFRLTFTQPEILDETPLQDMMMNAGNRMPTISEQQSGPLWFQRMDTNLDGDVSWREFLGPRTAFERLDQNRDRLIGLEEATLAEQLRLPETGTAP